MSVRLVVKNSLPASASPYRLLDDRDYEIAWANQFLDAQRIRQLSPRSLRAYASGLVLWFWPSGFEVAQSMAGRRTLVSVRHLLPDCRSGGGSVASVGILIHDHFLLQDGGANQNVKTSLRSR
jgi:hypothetical protein